MFRRGKSPTQPSGPYLVIGLGNPGTSYQNTRHNAGFLALDALADHLGERHWKHAKTLHADYIETHIEGSKFILAKPQTFMNNSGIAAAALVNTFHVDPSHVLVMYDDSNLELGNIDVKTAPSTSGHNGIKSIYAHLPFAPKRLRIGIGPAPERIPHKKWVVGSFTKEELAKLETTFPEIQTVVESLLSN